MRQLTFTQKKLLRQAAEDCKRTCGRYPTNVDDLDHKVAFLIDSINPCEIFWQNANRFLGDYATAGCA